ncbi:MAG: MFS transporter [Thermoguttaceae bacterium]|nr:MFS transporter [Thermoguttaceae bacterium]MBQ4203338.1 MFS transporter [Thermoguttaceae bacterium]
MSSPNTTQAPETPVKKIIPSSYRWELLLLLFMAYFFHQADRAIFGVVSGDIKAAFDMSDEALGKTRTIMFTLMAFIVPFAGFIGDKWNKRRLLITCLFCWSVATVCTGCVTGVMGLIIFNSVGVVVAEAFYGPASTSLIASYHKETRSIALSVHQTAVYLSVIFCGLIAGWITEHYDWRHAFWFFGGASIVVGALLIWRLKDPSKVQFADGGQTDVAKPKEKTTVAGFLKTWFTTPSAILLTVGFTAIVFVNNAYLNVVPLFLQRKFELSPTAAGWNGMFWHHIAAFMCIYLGGFISDRISKTSPTFRPKLQFCAMLIGAPIVCMIGMASTLYAVYALFFAMGVCRGFYECNTHASVFETIPAKYRSSTVGVMILFAFLIGAWSAQMVGAFVDKYVSEFGTELGYELGYRYSFQILGATWILGAVCVGIAAFGTFKRDRERRIAMELAAEEAEKTAA